MSVAFALLSFALMLLSLLAVKKIEADQHHSFGKVKLGEVVCHDFLVENIYDKTMVIDSLAMSCSECSTIEGISAEKDIQILPGHSVVFKTCVDTSKIERRGTVKRQFYVVWHDRDRAHQKVTLEVAMDLGQ